MLRGARIRVQLIALSLTLIVPMALMLAYAIYDNGRQRVIETRSVARALAAVTASEIDRALTADRDVLDRISRRALIRAVSADRCDPFLSSVLTVFPRFANATVVDLSGRAICSAVPQPGGKPVSVADTEWFRRIAAEQRFVVGKPFVGPITGRWVSVLAYPIRDLHQRMIGVLGFPLDLEYFRPHVTDTPLVRDTMVGIITADGTFVWRSWDPDRWIGRNVGNQGYIQQLLRTQHGEVQDLGLDSISRFYAVAPVPKTDWLVYAGIPTESVYADVRSDLVRHSLILMLILLAILGLALIAARRIERPTRALAGAVRAVSNGQRDARAPAEGPAEIVEVAEEFNNMVEARFKVEDALLQSEATLKRAQVRAHIGSWNLDLNANRLTWSGETYRIFGLAPGVPLSYERFMACTYPEDRAAVDAAWQAALKGAPYDISHRILVGDEIKWVHEQAELTRDAAGNPAAGVGTVQDITESKRLEQALRMQTDRLVMGQRTAGLIVLDLDIVNDRRSWSDSPEWLRGPLPQSGEYPPYAEQVHPEDRERFLAVRSAAIDTLQRQSHEYRIVRTDGQVLWVHSELVILPGADGKAARLLAAMQDVTARKRAEEKIRKLNAELDLRVRERTAELRTAIEALQIEVKERRLAETAALNLAERLQNMTRRLGQAQEEERRRLAAEVHDGVCSNLAAIGLNLVMLQKQLPLSGAADMERRLANVIALVDEAKANAKDISVDLRPLLLEDRDLLPALEEYVRKFEGSTGIAVGLKGSDCGRRLAAEEKIALFRITQEALTNCAKHARAKAVAIELDIQANYLALSIADDGVGIDFDGSNGKMQGLGLLSMQERAEAISGKWRIESAPGEGTRVSVTVGA